MASTSLWCVQMIVGEGGALIFCLSSQTWRKFLKQANVFAKRHGGRYALTQVGQEDQSLLPLLIVSTSENGVGGCVRADPLHYA
jgi:hypothetical protein